MSRLHRKYPLAVKYKRKLSRYLSRLSFIIHDKYFLVNYYGGKIYLNLKESNMMMDRTLGVYEYWKTRLFMDLVRPGITVVDIGVNKGYFSLLAAKLMNDNVKNVSEAGRDIYATKIKGGPSTFTLTCRKNSQ